MLEKTLAHLGSYLAQVFEVPKERVGYADKEYFIQLLSQNPIPLERPCVVYSFSDLSPSGSGNRPARPLTFPGTFNLNLTEKIVVKTIPLNVSVSIQLLTNNLNDYFTFVKHYFKLVNGLFNVEFTEEELGVEAELDIPTSDLSSLSTPAGGKEGRDYDRGLYYLQEGSFQIGTYTIVGEEWKKVIRKILVEWEVNVVHRSGDSTIAIQKFTDKT